MKTTMRDGETRSAGRKIRACTAAINCGRAAISIVLRQVAVVIKHAMDTDSNYKYGDAAQTEMPAVSMSPSKNRAYIAEIDQLRAVAAMLVLFYHGLQLFSAGIDFDSAKKWVYSTNPALTFIAEGHSGVGLFIVLSGFVLSIGAIGNTISYKSFLTARVLRIYPMLLVCLMVAINTGTSDLINVLTTALPFNGAAVTGSIHGPFSAMSWAVAVEFQCYLIFPFLILFTNQRGSRFLVQVIAVALCLRLLATLSGSANPRDISYWSIVGRVDQFCLGIIAARLYADRRLQNISPVWFLFAAFFVVALLWAFNQVGGFPLVSWWKIAWPDFEGVAWAFFIVTYLSAGRRLPRSIGWMLSKLGEISYSFYLVHFALIVAVIKTSMALHISGNIYLDAIATTMFLVFPLTTALAVLAYRTIELPFLRMRPKYIVPCCPTHQERAHSR